MKRTKGQKKILITGGLGYIGTTLIETLNMNGYQHITVIDNLYWDQTEQVAYLFKHFPKTEFIQADITEWDHRVRKAVKEADVVIHLAALVGAPLCDKYPDEATKLNEETTKILADALSDHQLLIYPNSNSGYGTSEEDICTEESPMVPISLYGQTKLEGENYVVANHANHVVFRLATVFGTSGRNRLDLLVNNLTWRAWKYGKLEIFEPNARRNYIHVTDVASSMLEVIRRPEIYQGNVYNLGNDQINCTKMELALEIQHIFASEAELETPGYHEIMITEREGEDPDKRDYNVSSKKFFHRLMYPELISFETGVKQIVNLCQLFRDSDVPEGMKNY